MPTLRHHTVRVPATSANLGPGFDAFGVALAQHLVVRTTDRGHGSDRVRIVDGPAAELACGDENLIWRAFVAFCDAHEVTVPDVGLVTASDIPLERGLGSSSSAIVAGLSLARALTDVPCSDLRLIQLATGLEGHPDNVAPAVLGGLVACAVDDEGELVIRRVAPSPALRVHVFVPSERQATSTARAVLPPSLDARNVTAQAARAGHVLGGLIGVWPVAPGLAGDRFHEPARLAVMPGAAKVIEELRGIGTHAWLSGAGPSVAAAVPSRQDRVDPRLASIAQGHGFEPWDTGFDLAGAVVCPEDACAFSGAAGCVQCPRRRV